MSSDPDPNAIAVIGMAGRFPGARSVSELWANLRAGVESIEALDEDTLRASGVPPSLFEQENYVRACAFLEDPDRFDAAFFDVTPREAEILDPQQRVFLECAWEALEHAGYDPARSEGSVGVFAGAGKNHYFANNLLRNRRILETMGPVATTIASEKDFVATRVAYKLDLRGPSVSVQTACSTSLVAVHLACQSLLALESDVALAGGVSISNFVRQGYPYVDGGIFSPDGHLRAFDAAAAGQVGGNGAAVVVLKSLARALEDGDTIHAVIRGSAINNDGVQKVSFNAPAVEGQARVIAEALEVAGVAPEEIEYVECHGTGTHLGDPIEVAALKQAYRGGAEAVGTCGLGSLKTNVGHLDAAAGAAGLIKATLALREGEVPPSLHFERPNPELGLEGSPFFVDARLRPWPRRDRPRFAAVSSFGMGGTNAHAVLEEAPEARPCAADGGPQLLVLSARSERALDEATEALARHLEGEQGGRQALADVAHTLQVGRHAFELRRAAVARDHTDAARALRAGRAAPRTCDPDGRGASLAFLFSGQGSQYAQMGRGLYEAEQVYAAAVDRACGILADAGGPDLLPLLHPASGGEAAANEALARTENTQPALFVVEYALAELLAHLGIEPRATLGHSIGEYVAAQRAGVFSLEDALALVAARGRLIGGLPEGGGMLSVGLSEAALVPRLSGELSVAVVNAPELCVVAGPLDELETLRSELRAERVTSTRLRTSHAFHSALMDPILGAFEEVVRRVRLSPPAERVVSCTTGDWLSAEQATDPGYWVRHLREPVRFADGVRTLLGSADVLLEVGPGEALRNLAKLTAAGAAGDDPAPVILSSTRAPKAARDDREVLLDGVGQLWCAGVAVDWTRLHAGGRRLRVPLPTYPFQRRRFWVEPEDEHGAHSVPAKEADPARWFWVPSWRRAAAGVRPGLAAGAHVLVVADAAGRAGPVVAELARRGVQVTLVVDEERGASSSSLAGATRTLPVDLVARDSHARVLDALDGSPDAILYLPSATAPADEGLAALDEQQERAFHGLVALAQAWADRESAQPARLTVVTAGLADVLEPATTPGAATALGVCKAVRAELPSLRPRAVDLDPASPAEDPHEAALLVDECLALPDDEEEWRVALRAGARWVPDVSRVALPAAESDPSQRASIPSPHPSREDRRRPRRLRENGVVIVTGGLGGVGRSLAGGLVDEARARLVLVGRRELPAREGWDAWLAAHDADDPISRGVRAVRALEERGAEVLLVTADVGDPDAARRAVDEARARFGAVHGVIHAAGLAGDGLLALKTRAAAARVLDPKVRGTRALCLALADEQLDFFVLCSSLATQLEAVGQVDYFAANAFLDASAHATGVGSRLPLVSIAWEAWREVGMAAREAAPGALREGREESLRLGLAPEEGREVLRRVLASGLRQVLVSTHDLPRRVRVQREETRRLASGAEPEPGARPRPAGGAHERPRLATAYVEPATGLQRAVAGMWCDLLGVDRVGVDDDFFALGGNSLLLMQVSARLRNELDFAVSMRELFDTPTVASLCERMETLRLLDGVTDTGAAQGSDDEVEEFRL